LLITRALEQHFLHTPQSRFGPAWRSPFAVPNLDERQLALLIGAGYETRGTSSLHGQHKASRFEVSRTAAPVSPDLLWQQPTRPPAPRTCVKPDPTAPRAHTYLAVDREAASLEAGISASYHLKHRGGLLTVSPRHPSGSHRGAWDSSYLGQLSGREVWRIGSPRHSRQQLILGNIRAC
jgi:hypothetical protein